MSRTFPSHNSATCACVFLRKALRRTQQVWPKGSLRELGQCLSFIESPMNFEHGSLHFHLSISFFWCFDCLASKPWQAKHIKLWCGFTRLQGGKIRGSKSSPSTEQPFCSVVPRHYRWRSYWTKFVRCFRSLQVTLIYFNTYGSYGRSFNGEGCVTDVNWSIARSRRPWAWVRNMKAALNFPCWVLSASSSAALHHQSVSMSNFGNIVACMAANQTSAGSWKGRTLL